MALAISAAIGSADGMTPTERWPRSAPPVLRRCAMSCCSDAPVVENGVRPLQHPLAVGREADEALAALDDGHAQLLLELPDAARQRGLRHVAGLGRAREVLFAREGDEVLELADVHGEGFRLQAPGFRPGRLLAL